jgi:hypothetical protein
MKKSHAPASFARRFRASGCVSLLLCALAAPGHAQIPTNGLVANYEFTGNAQDSGPSGLHGTIHGALLTTDRFGNASRAYVFNGTSDYIEIADNNAFTVPTTGSLSISVWMRPDVLIFPVDESSGYVHWMGKGVSGQHEWVARMYSFDNTEARENRTSFYMFNLTGGLGAGSYVQEPITTGVWIHYVAVVSMSADTITWYKNGVQKDQDTFQISQYNIVPGNGTAPVRIGTRDFASYFKGAIDDIRFYNRVLSLAEIQQLYTEGSGGIPPGSPTGLAATAGNAQVVLGWNASVGATSYNVKRATVTGGPYTPIASGVTSTSHTDTTVINGTTYYYVVSAVNGSGESADSGEVSATPQAPQTPPAPTGLAATSPTKKKINLTWNASAGATSYNVKRSTVNGGPYTTIAPGVTSTSYTNGGLTSGTTYYYVVSAVNAGGESANSNQASAVAK